jgi:hypothetical protein
LIDQLLSFDIVLVNHPDNDEINNLIKREEICSLAKTQFIKGEISFQDFLDCLEVAEISIDEYLPILNENCRMDGF